MRENRKIISIGFILMVLSLPQLFLPINGYSGTPSFPPTGFEDIVCRDIGNKYIGISEGAEVVNKIYFEDDDSDKYDLVVTEVVISSVSSAGAEDIESIALLNGEGEEVGKKDIESFPAKIKLRKFPVADDGKGEIKFKIYLSDGAQAGKEIRLEFVLIHDEGYIEGFKRKVSSNRGVKITRCHPVSYVVAKWNVNNSVFDPENKPTVQTDELLNAISWWEQGKKVPRACGKKLDTDNVLELIDKWSKNKKVSNNSDE